MTEKEINIHLKNGICEIAPDCLEQILEKVSKEEQKKDIYTFKKKWTSRKVTSYIAVMVTCFVLVVSGYGVYDKGKVTTIVELDINPSIEFLVNKSDKVIKVNGVKKFCKIIRNHFTLSTIIQIWFFM